MKEVKSKTRRRFLLGGILMSLLLLAVGGTIAYNSNLAFFNNLFHLKYGETKSIDITPPDNWKRCDTAPKEVTTTNDSTFNIRVRLRYDEFWRDSADENYLPLTHDGEAVAVVNLQNEDDWEDGNDGWMYWKGELAPGESTRSLLQSVTYNCDTDINTQTICTNTPTGTICEQPEDPYNGGKFHVFVTVQTTEEEFPEDTYYNVSINPNGGTYNGSSEIFTDRVRAGTFINLSDIERTDFEFHDWTLNDTSSYTSNMIRIDSDTNLVANWFSNIFHNVTVDPNGGTYDGKTEISTYSVREGSDYSILDTTRDTFALEKWVYVGGDHDGETITGNTLASVTEDITIKAIWAPAVARIERTGKLYTSIMRAEAEAIANDTITLLVDTEEVVTNEKTVTLDLNTHTVTGSLTNTENGNLTLINGEINNPDGIAVTNNGTLTMGVNDYKEDGKANIINNYIRLIGTHTSLKQNGVFNFYDGFLEGDIGLEGGYNAAPMYRNTFDDTIVHYFPLVDHIGDTERQHVELANADLAVSKTTVNGDIYYYNLQDNINTSAKTGYQIYAVRDFTASYPLAVRENENIVFDIDGWNVVFAETFTNNGNIEITNGKSEGILSASQTVINNNELTIKNAEITGTSDLDVIKNNDTLKLRGGTITASENGYVLQPVPNSTIDMDDDSYIRTFSTSKAAIRNSTNDFVINGGHITAPYLSVENLANSSFTMTGGSIETTQISRAGDAFGISCGSSSTILLKGNSSIIAKSNPDLTPNTNPYDASNITAISANQSCQVTLEDNAMVYAKSNGNAKGIESGNITLQGNSTLKSDGILWTYASYQSNNVTIGENTTATIAATSQNDVAVGIFQSSVYISSGTVIATKVNSETGGDATAVNCSARWAHDATCRISGGTITATNNSSGSAVAVSGYSDDMNATDVIISGGAITATANTGGAYGFVNSNNRYSTTRVVVSGGNISATSASNTGFGMNISATRNTVTGGTISGSTYGIYANNRDVTIGEDDGTQPSTTSPEIIGGEYGIYSGAYNFYDGIIRGGTNAYQQDVIKKIPDATIYYTEREPGEGQDETTPQEDRTGRENCWLVDAENYLEVDDVGYNSLTKAYGAIEGDSGTIKVIANAQIEAALPTSPTDKNITFDLNGHELIYLQSFSVDGPMTILDSSTEKTGKLSNPNTYAIVNNGDLTIQSGLFSSSDTTIRNAKNLTMSGGKVTAPYLSVENLANSSFTMTGGLVETTQVPRSGTVYGISCGDNCSVTMKNDSKIIVRSNPDLPVDSSEWDTSTGEAISASASSKITLENNASIISENKGYAYGIERGTITLKDNASIKAEGTWHTYALFDTETVNIGEDTTVSITANSAAKEASAVFRSSAIIHSGTISASTDSGDGASALNCGARWAHDAYCEIYGGTMTATNTGSGPAYASAGYSEEYNGTNINIYGGTFTANAKSGAAYGFANSTNKYNSSKITITGGTFTANSESGTGFGANINTTQNSITGGKIEGNTYGIYGNGRTIDLGEDDGTQPSTTSPEIIGGEYGIYSGAYNFYDGIIKAKQDPYENPDIINAIAENYTIKYGTETIGDETYQTSYLTPVYEVAKIGAIKYTSLSDAIAAANQNDKIELIADNYIFAETEIPNEKIITIDTAGYKIISSHPFTNNGQLALENSSSNETTLNYRYSQYYFTNSANAKLVLDGIIISSKNAIQNSGTLEIKNSTSITAESRAITNSGQLTLSSATINSQDIAISNTGTINESNSNQSAITGKNYAIYSDSGNVELSNSNLAAYNAYYQNTNSTVSFSSMNIDGRVINDSGIATIADSTLTETGIKLTRLLVNNDTATVTNSSITFTSTDLMLWGGEEEIASAISNGKDLTLNNVDIFFNASGSINKAVFGIHNTGQLLNMNDVNIASSFTELTWDAGSYYGLYNENGTVNYTTSNITTSNMNNLYGIGNNSGTINFNSGDIDVIANSTATGINNTAGTVNILSATISSVATTTYGINNGTGEINLGIPEPEGSPTRGKENADVSTTDPSIRSIGSTTGYGIKNGSGGRINYYDGIITATTHPMPEIPAVPTNTEYLYEPKIHTNSDGYQYMILEWMRG